MQTNKKQTERKRVYVCTKTRAKNGAKFLGDDIAVAIAVAAATVDDARIFRTASGFIVNTLRVRAYLFLGVPPSYCFTQIKHKTCVFKVVLYVCKVLVEFFGRRLIFFSILCTFSRNLVVSTKHREFEQSYNVIVGMYLYMHTHSHTHIAQKCSRHFVSHPLICNSTRYGCIEYRYFFFTIACCFPLYQTMLLLSAFSNLILFIQNHIQFIVYNVVLRLCLDSMCMCLYVQRFI